MVRCSVDPFEMGTSNSFDDRTKNPLKSGSNVKSAENSGSESFLQKLHSLEGFEEWLEEDEQQINEQFIIDLFSKLEELSSKEDGEWQEEILAGSDEIKAWKNMKGTHKNNKIPCIRLDWT